MRIKHGKLIFEYNQITKHIFLGTNMCCLFHFKKSLLRKGISADISLEAERIDNPAGVKYFLWLPTKDLTAPSQKTLKIGASFLAKLVKENIKCYVHCERGHGRSPTLVASYLIQEKDLSPKEAIAFIKKRRASIHLVPAQKKALEKFAKNVPNCK